MVLEFNWKSAFNSKYLNCVMAHSQLTQYICNESSQFNNCRVLTVCKVAIHYKYPKCPLPESLRVWTRLVMDVVQIQRFRVQLRLV